MNYDNRLIHLRYLYKRKNRGKLGTACHVKH